MKLADWQEHEGLTLAGVAERLSLASTGHASDLVTMRRGMPVEVAKRFAVITGLPWPTLFEANRRQAKPMQRLLAGATRAA